MSNALVWFLDAITGIPWLEVIKAIAPVATALIAFKALRNWQRQDKAKREAEFLDALVETTHTFVSAMPGPVLSAELTKEGFRAHEPIGDVPNREVEGIIAYTAKFGPEDAKRIQDDLTAIRPVVAKLHMLVAKGQMFRFEGYQECQHAADVLVAQFASLDLFASLVAAPDWDWHSGPLGDAVSRMLQSFKPTEMRDALKDNESIIRDFAIQAYKRIYG